MFKRIPILAVIAIAITAVFTPISLSGLRPIVPEFTKEKLLFLVSKDLMSDEESTLLTQAETHQLSDTEAKALYLSLNDLYHKAHKHYQTKPGWLTISRVAKFTVIGLIGAIGCFAIIGDSKPTPQPQPQPAVGEPKKPATPPAPPQAPPRDSIFVHKHYDTPHRPVRFREADRIRYQSLRTKPPIREITPEVQEIIDSRAHGFLPARTAPIYTDKQIAANKKRTMARLAANGGKVLMADDSD